MRGAFGLRGALENRWDLGGLASTLVGVLVVTIFFEDPRVRSSYDVFDLALLAARIADRFGLNELSAISSQLKKLKADCADGGRPVPSSIRI